MAIVAGVDFGTLNVRVSIFDSDKGRLGSATAEYPLIRKKKDPDHATQRHNDHLDALTSATKQALERARVKGEEILAIALDTTGSSVVPVAEGLVPLDDYYLWCDHRAKEEAALITQVAHRENLEAIQWYGGVYSSEWGFAKLLHWLRHNPDKRERMVSALEHCDMIAAVLCGITDPEQVPRSICAMGHKWMWNEDSGGLPPEEFLVKVDPLLEGVRKKLGGRYTTSDRIAGHLTGQWAERLDLKEGIPIPVGAFDAHWDAIGAGVREGDVVNVVGTSTCIMAIARQVDLIPGVCGVVRGSIHPDYYGIEAGLSATGDIFDAIARRAKTTVAELSKGVSQFRPGQTGMLRLTWDNGDRTVLVNAELGGVTLGWNLTHTAEDDLFAAIEGTAFHTRIILDRMAEHGVPIQRVINGGGIPQKNETLNQVYANVLRKPVLVPEEEVTSLGSAIFALMAARVFSTIEEAQQALCPKYRSIYPDAEAGPVYEKLFPLYKKLYFGLGRRESAATSIGDVLPALKNIATEARAR
ncbi:ribulokinase, partial [Acidobacteria bacterium AH-259-L09]|nr:ribulokinase [Acidobacteria bacterium AH-259-L09]